MNPVEQRFERVVQQILAHDRAIVQGLFSDQILSDLLHLMQEMRSADVLRPAAIGSSERSAIHSEIRSDFIHWWPDAPDHPAMHAYLSVIDDLSNYLNRTCFTGISSREFMFAAYPPGARYARHLDDFQNKNARKFSVITYLNWNWNGNGDRNRGGNRNGNGDGGELILYGASGIETVVPTFGTTVIFPSAELEHEVLPARRERYSVTGWLR